MTDESKIREKAYELWEQAGSPEDGPSETYWHRARSLLEAQEGTTGDDPSDGNAEDLQSGADQPGTDDASQGTQDKPAI
jgi:hypothetical protein